MAHATRVALPGSHNLNPTQGLMHMWKTDGMRGMFKGNGTNCVRIIPNSAVKFLTYEQLSRRISLYMIDNGGDGQMTPGLRLAAGAGAGIIGMSATYPLDTVRGRLTVQSGTNQQYRGIWHATRVIVQEVRSCTYAIHDC